MLTANIKQLFYCYENIAISNRFYYTRRNLDEISGRTLLLLDLKKRLMTTGNLKMWVGVTSEKFRII